MVTAKRLAFIAVVVTLAVGATLFMTADKASAQGRPSSERSLVGTYYFNIIQIRDEVRQEVYSNSKLHREIREQTGTATFFGDGTMHVSEHHNRYTDLLDIDALPIIDDEGESDPVYTVSADGVVEIWNGSAVDARGRILDNGRLILFDGAAFPNGLQPILYHGIAVKQ